MDDTEEIMTLKEMLEKIAERDYSLNQQRDLTAKMRHWLDAAEDDVAMLRSENIALQKQVKAQERIISEARQEEAEPCSPLTDDLSVMRCSEMKIQELEKENTMMKEQNKKLTEELKSLQREKGQDKISLSKIRVTLQTLESELEEAQIGIHYRDEVIHQRNLQLKNLEEMVEEHSNVIESLRLTNRELEEQLKDKLDESSFSIVNDLMTDSRGSLSPPLSFAEEIKLLASSAEVKTSLSDLDLQHEETDAKLLKPQNLTVDRQTKRCAGILETAIQRARLILMFVVMTAVLVFVASGSCTGNLFSINTLWSGARLMLQPYCSVHYGALPPI